VSTVLLTTGGTIGIRAFTEVAELLQGKTPQPLFSSLLSHAHGAAKEVAAVASDAATAAADAALPAVDLLLTDPTMASIGIAACLGSVALKEAVYRWTMRVGLQMRSQALISNALHHRADSLSSAVAAVGIGGAFLGIPVLDPLAAVVVGGMIAKAGAETGWNAVRELMDERLDEEAIATAVDVIAAHKEVVGVRRIRSRRSGPAVLVDCELAIAPDVSVGVADELARSIRSQVFRERREISEFLVNFVPADEHDSMESPLFRGDGTQKAAAGTSGGANEEAHGHSHGDASTPSTQASAKEATKASLPRYSMEELKESVRAAVLGASAPGIPGGAGSPFRALTALEVHAESSSSRLLHVHAKVHTHLNIPVRDALVAIRKAQARVKALQLPAYKQPLEGKMEDKDKAAVWTVAIADIQLETNPL
jgi:cation diffusion facilitator family transporter